MPFNKALKPVLVSSQNRLRMIVNNCTAGSSLLGRAKQLGPHSFVSLSLFPANDQLELAIPPLQTSFQAQTFCPEFHFRRQLPLQVDARLIRELSTQVSCNGNLELAILKESDAE